MAETATTQLLIPASVAEQLPSMVRNELGRLSVQKQEEFLEDYRRRAKSVGVAYLCWFLLGVHYGYQGKWGLQVLYWLTAGGFFVWMFIDIFRIPGMIRNRNKDLATDVMRNLKAIAG